MPDHSRLDDAMRRAMDANIRYYRALGEVTVDYMRALSGLWGDVRLPVDLGTFRFPDVSARAEPPSRPAPPAEPQPVLVLEAAAGHEARGVFLVENHLGRTVSTTVRIGAFATANGAAASPRTRVEPEAIVLEPGESALVHLVAHVDDALEPDLEYRAQVDVPDLAAAGIPVVLRRMADDSPDAGAAESEARGGGADEASTEPKASGRATRSKPAASSTRGSTKAGAPKAGSAKTRSAKTGAAKTGAAKAASEETGTPKAAARARRMRGGG
jgi:hypothetical protein